MLKKVDMSKIEDTTAKLQVMWAAQKASYAEFVAKSSEAGPQFQMTLDALTEGIKNLRKIGKQVQTTNNQDAKQTFSDVETEMQEIINEMKNKKNK